MSFKLYLDMDGVLADFETGLLHRGIPRSDHSFHVRPRDTWTAAERALDEAVSAQTERAGFWERLPVMPGALELAAAAATRYDTYILTATPARTAHRERIAAEKIAWAEKNLHFPAHRVITCLRSQKQLFAGYGTALIDDTALNCEEWMAAGGVAHQFVSMATAIEFVKGLK